MLARLRSRITYANVVATLALFIAVGGGTAFAVVAANQVNSASIINGQVKNADLGANSVGSSKVGKNSLTSADINEGTLGRVPDSAKLGGRTAAALLTTGGQSSGGSCDPTTTNFVACGQVSVGSSVISDFLVVAGGSWYGGDQSDPQFGDGNSADGGSCVLVRGGGPPGTEVTVGGAERLGQLDNAHSAPGLADGFGLTAVAVNVPAGTTTFKVMCAESNKDFQVQDVGLTAVRLDRP
jgi:hypothetical protein